MYNNKKEFKLWHLTPNGWVEGSFRTDFNSMEKADPPDLIATYEIDHGGINNWLEGSFKFGLTYEELKDLMDKYPIPF